MANDYFDSGDWTAMVRLSQARAEAVNSALDAVEAGFDKLPSETNIKQGKINYAVDTGAANAYVVSLPHAPASYSDGLEINVKIGAGNTNTSTSCAINVNSLGAVAIKDYAGNNPAVGDLAAGAVIPLRHNGTNFRIVGATVGAAASASSSATAAASSASAAATSASSASSSATSASSSANAAAASATSAAASAAALNVPNPTVALNFLRVNAGATAYELRTPNQVLSDIGSQASHANLAAFAGLTLVADQLPYANGSGTLALTSFTSFGRTFVGYANAATAFSDIKQAASESVTGVVEIATAAETTTGTDDARVITPLKLTTFAPASATIDTAADKLLAIDADDSNKVKQMAFPSIAAVNDILLFQDQKTSGTIGDAYTAGAWRTHTVNTEVVDTGSIGSISSNQITLAAGSYIFWANANTGHGNGASKGARLRLRNVTDGTTVAQGVNFYAATPNTDDALLVSCVGQFTIATSKVFEFQVYPVTADGAQARALSTGEVEVHLSALFRRYAT